MYLFDMDGTLIDSNDVWKDVDREFLARRGLPYTKAYYEGVAHTIFPLAAKFTKEFCNLPDSEEDIMAEWMELAKDAYAHVTVRPGVRAFLKQCKAENRRMALVTSSVPVHCRTAMEKLDDWPFNRVARMEDMPVPIHRHTVSSINEVLTRWGGITTNDLDTAGVCYLEEYDAYYTFTSDFNMFYFIAESGEQVGNYVYLRKSVENGNIAVLTLRLMPGTDEWQIVSHWRSGS